MSEFVTAHQTEGRLGIITLSRERALNACSKDMVESMHSALDSFIDGSTPAQCLLLESSTERAFCAGGDIKALRQAVLDVPYAAEPPQGHLVARVFQAEYALVVRLARLPVPAAALCDGVWMGFGTGLAAFLPVRVVTEGTVFAMPECAIGLWPDVGFALFAARRGQLIGLYLALTGARLTHPADLIHVGLATHYVPRSKLADLQTHLARAVFGPDSASKTLHDVVGAYCQEPDPAQGSLPAAVPLIEKTLRPGVEAVRQHGDAVRGVAAIFAALESEMNMHEGQPVARKWLAETREQMLRGSPRSLALTLAHFCAVMRDAETGGALGDIAGCMRQEFRIAIRLVNQHDFIEGVRAAVVDKDRNPKWEEGSIEAVDKEGVDALLETMSDLALQL